MSAESAWLCLAELPTVPLPPLEQLPPWALWSGAGGSVVVGAVLLLYGRVVGRAAMALAGAGAGYAAGTWAAPHVQLPPVAVQASAAAAGGILCLLAARLLWALLAAALFGGVAAALVVARFLNQPAAPANKALRFDPNVAGLAAYGQEAQRFAGQTVKTTWDHTATAMLVGLLLGAGVPLLVCLVRPRLGKIFMTALLAALLIVGGGATAACLAAPALPEVLRAHWYAPAGAAGGLLLFGLIWQYRAAFAADRSAKGREAEPRKKGKSKGAAAAEKD
jgi:hypothetical protein